MAIRSQSPEFPGSEPRKRCSSAFCCWQPAGRRLESDPSMKTAFDSIEAVIEDLRRGRMVIVVDDADRENEGDLIMAAEHATPRSEERRVGKECRSRRS